MEDTLRNFFQNQITEHELVIKKIKENLEDNFLDIIQICYKSIKSKNKLIFFGNGGSASDAQHLSTELTVRFSKNRKAIPALSLVTDTSAISAISNDFGFEYLFSRQLEALGKKGDVAIGITTSGNSKNVIMGLRYAKENGLRTIAFTGRNIKNIEKITDAIISIPALNTSRVQEAHILLGQMMCNALEFKLKLSPLVNEQKK
tara:strand:- start:1529 stop:2137 length:609 start_codon:yes stop_codon:yes gene_type:complete